jgi:hypothetical protein
LTQGEIKCFKAVNDWSLSGHPLRAVAWLTDKHIGIVTIRECMAAQTRSWAAILRHSTPHSLNRGALCDGPVKFAQCVLFLPPFIPEIRRAASVAILSGFLQGFLSSSAASADRTLTLQCSTAPGAEEARSAVQWRLIRRLHTECPRLELPSAYTEQIAPLNPSPSQSLLRGHAITRALEANRNATAP